MDNISSVCNSNEVYSAPHDRSTLPTLTENQTIAKRRYRLISVVRAVIATCRLRSLANGTCTTMHVCRGHLLLDEISKLRKKRGQELDKTVNERRRTTESKKEIEIQHIPAPFADICQQQAKHKRLSAGFKKMLKKTMCSFCCCFKADQQT